MKKNSIPVSEIPERTIGLDLSDRTLRFCELNAKGEIVKEGQLKLNWECGGMWGQPGCFRENSTGRGQLKSLCREWPGQS
jgi:hypothetical protein